MSLGAESNVIIKKRAHLPNTGHSQSRTYRDGSNGMVTDVGAMAAYVRNPNCEILIVNDKDKSRESVRATNGPSSSRLSLPELCDLSSTIPMQQNASESWQPFSCTCKHCGLKFGKHSIAIHERRCSLKQQSLQGDHLSSNLTRVHSNTLSPVARIVTIGLGSVQCEQLTVYASLPPRPDTQTLRHSSLRDSGHGLPYVPSSSGDSYHTAGLFTSNYKHDTNSGANGLGMTLCERCGMVVAADRVGVHSRLCKSDALGKVSTNSVQFPSTRARAHPKVEQEISRHTENSLPKGKPPTVVCYICGREYGTKSIAIHEPQCLKKFESENRKLPINERKPLPKKSVVERPKLVRIISKEEPIITARGHPIDNELLNKRMDLIFQQCYADFERELVPCKKCGRKFAPDRHKQHEPNCNAKPLSSHKLKPLSVHKSKS